MIACTKALYSLLLTFIGHLSIEGQQYTSSDSTQPMLTLDQIDDYLQIDQFRQERDHYLAIKSLNLESETTPNISFYEAKCIKNILNLNQSIKNQIINSLDWYIDRKLPTKNEPTYATYNEYSPGDQNFLRIINNISYRNVIKNGLNDPNYIKDIVISVWLLKKRINGDNDSQW